MAKIRKGKKEDGSLNFFLNKRKISAVIRKMMEDSTAPKVENFEAL